MEDSEGGIIKTAAERAEANRKMAFEPIRGQVKGDYDIQDDLATLEMLKDMRMELMASVAARALPRGMLEERFLVPGDEDFEFKMLNELKGDEFRRAVSAALHRQLTSDDLPAADIAVRFQRPPYSKYEEQRAIKEAKAITVPDEETQEEKTVIPVEKRFHVERGADWAEGVTGPVQQSPELGQAIAIIERLQQARIQLMARTVHELSNQTLGDEIKEWVPEFEPSMVTDEAALRRFFTKNDVARGKVSDLLTRLTTLEHPAADITVEHPGTHLAIQALHLNALTEEERNL